MNYFSFFDIQPFFCEWNKLINLNPDLLVLKYSVILGSLIILDFCVYVRK